MRINTPRQRIRIPVVCALAALLLVVAVPMGAVLAEPAKRQGNPVEFTLEHLSDVLARLETELAALKAPAADKLEEGLGRAIELVGDLLEEFDRPAAEGQDGAAAGARIVELDLLLHRLLYALDEVVEGAAGTPARLRAKGALDGTREWIDGYIGGVTARMDPKEAAHFEKAAHEMIRSLAERLADMARGAEKPERGRPVLARLVEQLEELLFRLDGLILRRFNQPPAQG